MKFRMIRDIGSKLTLRTDRGAQVFVLAVWLMMLLMAFGGLIQYGRNVPLAEDWYFVAPLTGHEPNLVEWLWAQNNEHRVPLPRLILLTLLKLAHGDFRAGMVLNILTLGGLAFGMMQVARYVRGGHTRPADAFFPLALLHVGNWPNLFWGWQFSFVLSTTLACTIFLILISRPALNTLTGAIIAGICLVCLPLTGATGLLFVPFLALWLGYCGFLQGRQQDAGSRRRLVSGFLIGSAIIAWILLGLYLAGYERPSWNPPNPGLGPTLKTTAMFLAVGFGPVAQKSWQLSVVAAFGILVPSAGLAMLSVYRQKGLEKHRALALLLFFGNLAVFALAMGWGRAAQVPEVGLPMRYVLLSVPLFVTVYFVWELYGPSKLRMVVQAGFLLGMLVLLPFNTREGFFKWGDWYDQGMTALEQDLSAGQPTVVLAEKHRDFLIHWWDEEQLVEGIQMLQDAEIGPFAQMPKESFHAKSSIHE